MGASALIFPRFILDESLGFHADRARGPLLQAVANGVSLNMLGLLALHAYRRGSVRGLKIAVLLASVPVAILATMTRAVWLSFAGTVVVLDFSFEESTRCGAPVWDWCWWRASGWSVVLSSHELGGALSDRLEERGPVDYRAAVYAGGWQMFLDRPLTGWGFHQMPAELPRYVSGYKEKVLYPHNTYLELLVEDGVAGAGTLFVADVGDVAAGSRGDSGRRRKWISRSAVSPDVADSAGGVLGECGAGGHELSVCEWFAVHDGGNAGRAAAEGGVLSR